MPKKCKSCGEFIIPLSEEFYNKGKKYVMWYCQMCQGILGITNVE